MLIYQSGGKGLSRIYLLRCRYLSSSFLLERTFFPLSFYCFPFVKISHLLLLFCDELDRNIRLLNHSNKWYKLYFELFETIVHLPQDVQIHKYFSGLCRIVQNSEVQ